jgi:y4mF family transcriptional regulator
MASKSSRSGRKPRSEPRRLRDAPSDLVELARLIRSARIAQGLTQVDLGGLANVGERFVVEAEQAKPTLAVGKLMSVCAALGYRLQATPRSLAPSGRTP